MYSLNEISQMNENDYIQNIKYSLIQDAEIKLYKFY